MVLNRALILGALALTTVVSPCGGEDIVADHVGSYGTTIYQSHGPSGQFTQEFDEDELFYVDLGKKETVWRLPMFSQFAGFDPQGALSNIAAGKHNLDVLKKRSNFTPAINEVPEVTVFSKTPVILGQPNTLICHVDNIFPPVINITWLKNGHAVTEGISKTSFLPKDDHSFLKIGYLTFLPSDDDVYDCKVEHWGLDEPLLKHWEPEIPAPMSELTETVVCALGLTVGLVGIVVGTIFIIQGLRSDSLSPVEIRVEEVDQQMDPLTFLSVSKMSFLRVCMAWSHCAFENVLATMPKTFHSAIIESMHYILDGIMEQL